MKKIGIFIAEKVIFNIIILFVYFLIFPIYKILFLLKRIIFEDKDNLSIKTILKEDLKKPF